MTRMRLAGLAAIGLGAGLVALAVDAGRGATPAPAAQATVAAIPLTQTRAAAPSKPVAPSTSPLLASLAPLGLDPEAEQRIAVAAARLSTLRAPMPESASAATRWGRSDEPGGPKLTPSDLALAGLLARTLTPEQLVAWAPPGDLARLRTTVEAIQARRR